MNRPLFAYFGHHKCATSWTTDIVAAVCHELELKSIVVDGPWHFGYDLPRFVATEAIDFVCYTNAVFDEVRRLPRLRGFHMIRDPRDVCVSMYFSHRDTHPLTWEGLAEERDDLRRMSKQDGLNATMARYAALFDAMAAWDYANPDVLELRMEDVTADPFREIVRAFGFLGLVDASPAGTRRLLRELRTQITHAVAERSRNRVRTTMRHPRLSLGRLLEIVWMNDFSRKAGGRARGQEDRTSHYRLGTPGDWRNHFTAANVEQFKLLHGECLIRLGYEMTNDW